MSSQQKYSSYFFSFPISFRYYHQMVYDVTNRNVLKIILLIKCYFIVVDDLIKNYQYRAIVNNTAKAIRVYETFNKIGGRGRIIRIKNFGWTIITRMNKEERQYVIDIITWLLIDSNSRKGEQLKIKMKTLILRKERRLLLENAKVYQKYPNRTRRKKNYNSNTQTMENINEKKIKIMELYTPKIIYEYKEMTEEKEKQVKEWLEKTREQDLDQIKILEIIMRSQIEIIQRFDKILNEIIRLKDELKQQNDKRIIMVSIEELTNVGRLLQNNQNKSKKYSKLRERWLENI
ncbi:unnamed protein product [Rhizophagus irregularis]|nr:unnamed protein product [Rhizophagus irregularis]